MEQSQKFESETEQVFRRWVAKTTEVLLFEIQQKDVLDTEDLRKSLNSRVSNIAEGYLKGDFSFLERGRFVDMGAGRKRNLDSSTPRKGRGQKVRKPKKWFSRPFYGRINDLEGVMGIKLMEYSVQAIKQELS